MGHAVLRGSPANSRSSPTPARSRTTAAWRRASTRLPCRSASSATMRCAIGSSPPASRCATAASAAPSRSPLRQRASARSASASRSRAPTPAICSSDARASVSSPPGDGRGPAVRRRRAWTKARSTRPAHHLPPSRGRAWWQPRPGGRRAALGGRPLEEVSWGAGGSDVAGSAGPAPRPACVATGRHPVPATGGGKRLDGGRSSGRVGPSPARRRIQVRDPPRSGRGGRAGRHIALGAAAAGPRVHGNRSAAASPRVARSGRDHRERQRVVADEPSGQLGDRGRASRRRARRSPPRRSARGRGAPPGRRARTPCCGDSSRRSSRRPVT